MKPWPPARWVFDRAFFEAAKLLLPSEEFLALVAEAQKRTGTVFT